MKSTTQKYLCWLWIILLTTLVAVGFFRADADKIETDIQALLPQTTGTASAAKVLRTLSNNIAADVFLLISASEISNTQSAAQIVYQELSKMGFTPSSPADDISPKLIREIFLAYRENFLTAEDRAWLASSDDQALLSRALRILYRPISNNLLGPSDDPLGLFQNWLNSRTQQTSFTIRGPWLMVSSENTDYVVLRIRRTNAISADASLSLTHAIESASSIAKETIPSAQVLAAGMPLIAENTAAQAARESSLIGGISTLGILALTLVFLGRIRPVLTILGTLTIAVTIAFSVTFISFGSIHIITLVFGATLLGVCVDYIFHYLLTPADKHSLLFSLPDTLFVLHTYWILTDGFLADEQSSTNGHLLRHRPSINLSDGLFNLPSQCAHHHTNGICRSICPIYDATSSSERRNTLHCFGRTFYLHCYRDSSNKDRKRACTD